MNVINTQFVRNFLVKPLLKNVIFDRFHIGDIVHGRIIQALPQKNLFVLQTRGMNLIANTNLSLFVGDRVMGKVLNIKDQIELKLLEVNGKLVQQNMNISEDGLAFVRIPLSENIFGKEIEYVEDFQKMIVGKKVDYVKHKKYLNSKDRERVRCACGCGEMTKPGKKYVLNHRAKE